MKKNELMDKILEKPLPEHVALILDGNGRWAKKHFLPRVLGHKKGADTFREIVKSASLLGINYLTAYVFSTENWSRPQEEVEYIMKLIVSLCSDYQKLIERNIKLMVIGSRNHVPSYIIDALDEACNKTKDCTRMTLVIAFNYGAKEEIVHASKEIARLALHNKIKVEDIDETLFEQHLYTKGIPPVDLMIRTSGEVRLSNYLLWQNAYAEMIFTKTFWPDFHTKEFYESILEFQNRNRRFGGLK